MKTSKPLSAVSYNTDTFLHHICGALLKSGVLTNYAYIRHKGEDGDKDHIHLLLFPAKAVDTCKLPANFLEVVEGEAKPRGLVGLKQCRSVVDWVRYGVHDSVYLSIKGERRQYQYAYTDFVVGSEDEWRAVMDEVRFTPLPCPSYGVARNIILDALEQNPGVSWRQLLVQVPFAPRDIPALREYYDCLRRLDIPRTLRKTKPEFKDLPDAPDWDAGRFPISDLDVDASEFFPPSPYPSASSVPAFIASMA